MQPSVVFTMPFLRLLHLVHYLNAADNRLFNPLLNETCTSVSQWAFVSSQAQIGMQQSSSNRKKNAQLTPDTITLNHEIFIRSVTG